MFKPAFLAKRPTYPNQWSELPGGRAMLWALEEAMKAPSRQMFGYHLVKLGNLSSALKLSECPIKHKVSLANDFLLEGHCQQQAQAMAFPIQQQQFVQGKLPNLPLQENSVDALILANELDFTRDPHQILREIDRVIMPNGHLLIAGFNPLSAVGLRKLLPFKKRSLLAEARCFHARRVKDWLQLLNFEIVEHHYVWPRELKSRRSMMTQSTLLSHYINCCASLYLLVARKRELPLSLIKPKWSAKPGFRVVGANARVTGYTSDSLPN